MDINVVTVIGATGTLGKLVSGIFASFGNAKVYMISRDIEKIKVAKTEAALSVKSVIIEKNLIPKTFEDLEECVKNSDLIFESVVEDYTVKEKIHTQINNYVKEDCIIATGTSGLSINKLAKCYSEKFRKNFVGLHFFNPPYNLTLCELILSEYNEKDNILIDNLSKYMSQNLKRDIVQVKDEPAFLGNRIGFQFMNEALQYAEKYKDNGGIDYIDSILGNYTGRSMAPILTVDFVGLDVHKAIVDNIYNNTNDFSRQNFVLPEYMKKLIESGSLGKKTKIGLYKKDSDNNKMLVYDIKNNNYREVIQYNFEFKNNVIKEFKNGNYKKGIEILENDNSEESKICMHFLLKYIIYSIFISNAVSNDINDCDIAMATGFNWIPPCSLIEALGGKEKVIELYEKNLELPEINYKQIIQKAKKSKYDFRKFLKAN